MVRGPQFQKRWHRGLDGTQSRGGRVIEHYLASTGNETTIPWSPTVVTYLLIYLQTYSLHGTESFLRS